MKVTPVSCICVPVQIWQVTYEYKKEVKKLLKNLSPTDTLIKQGKNSLPLPSKKKKKKKKVHIWTFV